MTEEGCLIDGKWQTGSGPLLSSIDPSTGDVVWSGTEARANEVRDAIAAARKAQPGWEQTSLQSRQAVLERFAQLVEENNDRLAILLSREAGKPRWEAATEIASVIGKVQLSIDAHSERSPTMAINDTASLTYRPLGVIGVLGPFNFPAHLPNGQIVPALLAGNTVVYKPSELTPGIAAEHVRLLTEAGLPAGVINMVTGGRAVGEALVGYAANGKVDGVAFTGSVNTGRALHRALADRPDVLLALEMGGNNPLVVGDVDDVESAVNVIVRSAFITAGQRCTCARRLYIPRTDGGDRLLAALVDTTTRLQVGAPESNPEPFMGPVISEHSADQVRRSVSEMVSAGAESLVGPGEPRPGTGFVEPTILECSDITIPDDEIFGPVLAVQRYDTLDEAFAKANETAFGLAAGFIGTSSDDFDRFRSAVRAGLINWNAPTTGASGRLPFGGVGASGNHRPAGWTAADFCTFPVASVTYLSTKDAAAPIRGLT